MGDGESAIDCRDLTRRFPSGIALDRLTLDVHPGEVLALLGPNGAGKTTTMRLLNGVLQPDGGSATVLGLDPWSCGEELRRRTGVLTENAGLDERFTALENLEFVGRLRGMEPDVARRRITWGGFLLFAVVSNAVCWPVMHRIFVPTWLWAIVILWIAPAVAAVGLGIMVRVSIRANNTQEAQQLGGAVVLPLVILAGGQTTSLLLQGVEVSFLVGAVVWLLAIWLNLRGARAFTRERMASRL
jgi:ABC-type sugar transport system ATPase subunit